MATPVERRVGVAGVHREQAARHELAARDLGALQADRVGVRGELDVVADADRREHEAELGGHLAADERDALQQLAALALVDERDQPVADLELEHVERQGVPHRLGALQGGSRLRDLRRLVRACRSSAMPRRIVAPKPATSAPTIRNGTCGRPGTRPRQAMHRPAVKSGRGRAKSCPASEKPSDSLPAARVTIRPVAVEIRSAGICAAMPSPTVRMLKVWSASENVRPCCSIADHDAREEVDGDDDQAGDGVAAHELRGAVHRAVEVGLVLDLHAALARLGVGDLAGVQVGVDRHLLAGHGVEGEARADLGDAPGAARDHDELDDHEDQEHHDADDQVAADDEVPNAWITEPASPCGQDQPRDRDVDREPEQRREQQQRRERRELERLAGVHRHDDDQQRARDVHRHEQVEQLRRAAAAASSR